MNKEVYDLKVLFVEDEVDIREKIAKKLRTYFKTVYEAKDGLEGLELYKKYNPHILFLDIELPKLSGIELLKIIRKNDHSTKAIMLTAHSNQEILLKASELKLTKYLIKPLDRETLKESIHTLIDEMSNFKTYSQKKLFLGDNHIWDYENKQLFQNLEEIHLTKNERKILDLFANNINTTLSYDNLILYVWDTYEVDKMDTLKTTIKTLRKKLPAQIIQNVFAEGFKLSI